MKLLFQGSWKENRDKNNIKSSKIDEYCKSFAKNFVESNHQLILSSLGRHDLILAKEIAELLNNDEEELKRKVIFLLPDRIKEIPKIGTVIKFDGTKWWQEERTFTIQQSDALIVIGGGKGTSDSIQKAILANKPVFYPSQIQTNSYGAWKKRPSDYCYFKLGDADFNDNLNTTPDEYYKNVFDVLEEYSKLKYARNVFIVHGRDHLLRDRLISILEKLYFNPIVLDRQPNQSLTIIEKLERDVNNIGFSFILYTPDDFGGFKGENGMSRARQNVIFEHGLLIGMLGRDRTCAIINGAIELPSDLKGVIYEKVNDIENESIIIAKILKNAGYEVDLKNLI